MLNHNNMPGAGSVADTLEFMKKMWSGTGTPAMGMPSLSVDEINQKIADLKAVASWLEMNMNMLRATIQTMEVQSATLSTLQAMGAILTPNAGAAGAAGASASTPPFGFPAWPPQAAKTPEAASGAASKKAEPEPEVDEDENFPMPPDTAAASHEAGGEHSAGAADDANAAPTPDFQTAMGNPNAWWNLLQGQFTQAVGNALAEHNASQPEAKPKAVAKPKAKATAKSAAKATPKTVAKPVARAKSTAVQSGNPKPASRKPRPS